MKALIVSLGLALRFLASAYAEASDGDTRVEMKIITMPQDLALPVIASMGTKVSAEQLQKIDALVAEGSAEIEAWLIAHTIGGAMATSNTSDELRRPLEWNQPTVPGGSFGPKPPPREFSAYAAPTTFEVRDLGFQFEAEATVNRDGKHIDVACRSKRTRLGGWTRTAATFAESGLALSYPEPRIAVQSLNTRITVTSGEWILVGTFKEKGSPERIQLRMLRAVVRPKIANP